MGFFSRSDNTNNNTNSTMGSAGGGNNPVTELIIYTTGTCPYCLHAKDFFNENNIKYTEKRVDQDAQSREELIGKYKAQGVPLIVIVRSNGEEEVIMGFDRGKLEQMLNSGELPSV